MIGITSQYIEGAGREEVHQGRDSAQAAHDFAPLGLKTDALQRTCGVGLQLLVFRSQKLNLNSQGGTALNPAIDRTASMTVGIFRV